MQISHICKKWQRKLSYNFALFRRSKNTSWVYWESLLELYTEIHIWWGMNNNEKSTFQVQKNIALEKSSSIKQLCFEKSAFWLCFEATVNHPFLISITVSLPHTFSLHLFLSLLSHSFLFLRISFHLITVAGFEVLALSYLIYMPFLAMCSSTKTCEKLFTLSALFIQSLTFHFWFRSAFLPILLLLLWRLITVQHHLSRCQ